MSFYSDDSAGSATPFSGDTSVFDHPDVLLQSPITSERIVDTQSGFLLVIRRIGERLSLSCKRRVGTPPSSNILLTPDESVKLSRILASSLAGLEDCNEDPGIVARGPLATGGRRRFPFSAPTGKRPSSVSPAKALKIAGVAVALIVLLGGSYFAGKVTSAKAVSVAADPLSQESVDKFARVFVADMLDFNPDTYKVSQIHAMSSMSPELVEKYWKETNFPLSTRQLKNLPQGTTVMIERIKQKRSGPVLAEADIFAQLVQAESKISNPVHIRLSLGVSTDNTIKVVDQEDLTAAATPAE